MEKREEPGSWTDPFWSPSHPRVCQLSNAEHAGRRQDVSNEPNESLLWLHSLHLSYPQDKFVSEYWRLSKFWAEENSSAWENVIAVLIIWTGFESSESDSKLCLQLGFDTVSWITFTVPESVAWSSQQHCINKQWAMQSCQNKLISKLAAGFLQPPAKLWQYKQGHLQGGPPSPLYFKRFKDLFLNI